MINDKDTMENGNNKVLNFIEDIISKNDIVLFMKGTSDFPSCGYSAMVAQVLQTLGAKFKDINILEDNELRQGIKDFSDWPTIPQLYIKGKFIGGSDIVKEMYESGELSKIIKQI